MQDRPGRPGREACRPPIPFGASGPADQAQLLEERDLSDHRVRGEDRRRPRKIASLYIGRREGGQVVIPGKVRTGYTETNAGELR